MPDHPNAAGTLVLLAADCDGGYVVDQVTDLGHGHDRFRIVAPLVGDRLSRWVFGDERTTRPAAERRLAVVLEAFERCGLDATGELGDADPLQAIDDAMATFAADDLLLVTHPTRRRAWYEQHLAEDAAARFTLPITTIDAIPILVFDAPH
jgi:hypothetical protein